MMAASDGTIVEKEKIARLPEIPATEVQLNYAKDLGIKIPKDPTKIELSKLISQAEDEEALQKILGSTNLNETEAKKISCVSPGENISGRWLKI